MGTELTRAVVLLRGVNVGGNNRVPMADLRKLLVGLGYVDVVTLLNSGNAVFSAPPELVDAAEDDVEGALLTGLGVSCPVVVRTGEQLVAATAADPLGAVATDPGRHLVGFLGAEPSPAVLAWVAGLDVHPDQIRLVGRHAYLWLPGGVSAGPLSKLAWDRKLGVTVTTRNINTVAKLIELCGH